MYVRHLKRSVQFFSTIQWHKYFCPKFFSQKKFFLLKSLGLDVFTCCILGHTTYLSICYWFLQTKNLSLEPATVTYNIKMNKACINWCQKFTGMVLKQQKFKNSFKSNIFLTACSRRFSSWTSHKLLHPLYSLSVISEKKCIKFKPWKMSWFDLFSLTLNSMTSTKVK